MIANVQELIAHLTTLPPDATLFTTYSEDVESGHIDVGYDKINNAVQLVGSADDV